MTGISTQSTMHKSGAEIPPRQLSTVCHVVHSLGVGGAEVLVADMIRSLSDQFRCVVACLDGVGEIGESLRADGVPLTVLDRQPGIDWKCSRRLRHWSGKQEVSLWHVHQCTPMFQAMLARLPFGNTPLLLTEHGRHHPDLPSRKRSICHKLLLRKRDRLVAVGAATRDALIRSEGLPPQRVEVVYNGVDLTPFRDQNFARRTSVREELGLAADDHVAILVARLDKIKDHPTAIRTLHRVRESLSAAKLVIVGDGPERGGIESLIDELGLSESVKLLGTRRDVPRLLQAADTFVMTSLSEGIPLTIIEAMAAGLPIVSTNVGCIPEMITDNETGLLHACGDIVGLADSILRLARDERLRTTMTAAARQRAFEMFSREKMLARYADIYREMIDG